MGLTRLLSANLLRRQEPRPRCSAPLDTVHTPFTRNLRRTMGMKELSQKERNALNNVCAVLGTAFEGAAKVIDEARVLAVLKENNMDVNVAYDLPRPSLPSL